MTDREEQEDELLALSEILEQSDFSHQLSETGEYTGWYRQLDLISYLAMSPSLRCDECACECV